MLQKANPFLYNHSLEINRLSWTESAPLYLLSENSNKADRAETILRTGGTINVQVLNELANVTQRKLAMSWMEIDEFLSLIQSLCSVEPLTIETHEMGKLIAERYRLSVYDAMIVAAALLGECETLYSEDMQNGLLIDDQLRIPVQAV